MKWLDSENQKNSQKRIMTCDLDWLFELASEVCNLDAEEKVRCMPQHFFDDKSRTFSMEGERTLEVVGSCQNYDYTCAPSKVVRSVSGSGSSIFELVPELLSHGNQAPSTISFGAANAQETEAHLESELGEPEEVMGENDDLLTVKSQRSLSNVRQMDFT